MSASSDELQSKRQAWGGVRKGAAAPGSLGAPEAASRPAEMEIAGRPARLAGTVITSEA